MQIAPSELVKMSLWEFAAMIQGWNKANAVNPEPDPLKEADEEALFKFIEEKPIWAN